MLILKLSGIQCNAKIYKSLIQVKQNNRFNPNFILEMPKDKKETIKLTHKFNTFFLEVCKLLHIIVHHS